MTTIRTMARAHRLSLPTALPSALLLALMASTAGASPASSSNTSTAGPAVAVNNIVAEDEPWWHHAVIYQIYPRSFKDTNGDGLGDIKGITSELEYLHDIGVTGVWLSPFYPSPQADFGYDISDFKNVDPNYGTLDDFAEMVKKAHELGMKVVVDLVPNHSSDEHEWFKESAKGTEKYKDYYVWSEGSKDKDGNRVPPNNWVSHFRKSAWTYNDERKAFYLHQFYTKQPDLNYRNPAVVEEMKEVFRFWMGKGVDGFRVDALPFLFETNDLSQDEPRAAKPSADLDEDDYDFYTHPYTMDYPETYDMLHQWREIVDSFSSEKRVIMTECYTTFDKTIAYYGTKDKLGAHFTFNFELITSLDKSSNATDFKTTIDRWMNAMEDWRWPNWVIGNHDNKRVATRYPEMADAMNMISLTLPGTAMTYNGEELGMTDAFIRWDQTKDPPALATDPERYLKVSRDPCRTPMQWDDTTSAGFSTNPTTWMPTNPNYYELNVKKELATPKSHLNVYKDLTAARKTETMKNGALTTNVVGENVLVLTRSLENADTYITLVNVGSWEESVKAESISKASLKVYTASVNSKLSKGSAVPESFVIRPKEAIVLTTGEANGGTSAATVVHAAMSLVLLLPLLCMQN